MYSPRLSGDCASLVLLLAFINVGALAQSAPDSPPAGFPLPTGSPPIGLQAPLPAPTKKSNSPERAIPASPNIRAVLGRTATAPLTIDDAVALALYTNRSLATAEETLLQSQGKTSEARAAVNPTLSSLFTFTQLNQNTSATIAGQSFTLVNASQRQIGVSATLPIDISGMLRTATDQAKLQEIVARLDVNRARNQLVLDVKSAFYDVLRAQALLEVANEGLRNSLARQSDAQIRLDAGVATPYDVQRAATDVSQFATAGVKRSKSANPEPVYAEEYNRTGSRFRDYHYGQGRRRDSTRGYRSGKRSRGSSEAGAAHSAKYCVKSNYNSRLGSGEGPDASFAGIQWSSYRRAPYET